MQVKKPRAPMSAEHKAKLAAAQKAKQPELIQARVNADPKLIRFVTVFLYPLFVSYMDFVHASAEVGGDEKVKFRRYQKRDAKGQLVGPVSCSIEVSVLWMESEYGRTATGLFKKLFKRTSRGGWSTKAASSYTAAWVPNNNVYDQVIKGLSGKFTRNGKLEVYELIQLIETTVEYQYVPMWYYAEKQKNGLMKLVGDKSSKRMIGPDARAKVAKSRAEKKAYVDEMNRHIKRLQEIERIKNIELALQQQSLLEKIRNLTALVNTEAV